MMFTFRKTTAEDIPQIMPIIKQAKKYLKDNHVHQWVDDYPSAEIFESDIAKGHSYVLEKEHQIVATAAISFDGEPTYDQIHDGEWLSRQPFVVIHRIAVDQDLKGQGISAVILEHTQKMCRELAVHSIKIDTHRDNLSMQRFLEKNGFSYCGIIYLECGDERLAFEKII